MKKIYTFFITLLLFTTIAGLNDANASRIMGADMNWKCLGNDSFLVTAYVYRDCNGSDLSGISFDITPTCGGSATSVKASIGERQDITPVCGCCKIVTRCQNASSDYPFGIEQFTVQAVVYLPPPCCEYRVSFLQKARNSSITTGASGANFYTDVTINRCVKPCDNSPYFTTTPIMVYCADQCIVMNMGANDVDNTDSLVYKWVSPLSDYGTKISYNTGYSDSTPLRYKGYPDPTKEFDPPNCYGFHLDKETGEIKFSATQEDVTVMAIGVEEWRPDSTGKMVKIGEIRRDIQVNIIRCPDDRAPVITGIDGTNVSTAYFCVGQKKCFTIASFDPDKDDTVSLFWNDQIKGATFDVETGKRWPKGQFCWTPTEGDLRPFPYKFVVTGKDNACPLPAQSVKMFTIYVNPAPKIKSEHVNTDCGNIAFKGVNIGDVSIDKWSWESENGVPTLQSGKSSFVHKFANIGWIRYSVTGTNAASGCQSTHYDSIYINTYVQVKLPNDTVVCMRGTIPKISSTRLLGTGPYYYEWSTGEKGYDVASISNVFVSKDMWVWVTIKDGTGCNNFDSMHITVKEATAPKLGSDIISCLGKTVTLSSHLTEKMKTYEWYRSEKGVLTLLASLPHDSFDVKSEGRYQLRVINFEGCDAWDSVYVTMGNGLAAADFGYLANGLTVDFTINNQSVKMLSWDFGDGGTSILKNPSHTYSKEGTYDVTVYVTDACGDTAKETKSVVVSMLGIANRMDNNGMVLYPNPTSNLFTIKSNSPLKHVTVKDMCGKVLYTSETSQSELTIDISHFSKGIYLIEAISKNGKYVQKIMKK